MSEFQDAHPFLPFPSPLNRFSTNLAEQWSLSKAEPSCTGPLDGERLTSQLDAVLALMADHIWRTLAEIRAAIGRGSEAGLSARLREIRSSRRGVVERRRRGDPKQGLWEYSLRGL